MTADYFTNTPEDAARFEQQHGPLYPDDRPTASDIVPEWDGCGTCGRKSCADGSICDNDPDASFDDGGYAATALVLFVCIAGSLLFLFVLMLGRQAMCETHRTASGDGALSYCLDYQGSTR